MDGFGICPRMQQILCQAFSTREDHQALMIALTVAAKTLPWNRWRFKAQLSLKSTHEHHLPVFLHVSTSPGGSLVQPRAARCWLSSHCCYLGAKAEWPILCSTGNCFRCASAAAGFASSWSGWMSRTTLDCGRTGKSDKPNYGRLSLFHRQVFAPHVSEVFEKCPELGEEVVNLIGEKKRHDLVLVDRITEIKLA